ncbi:hypothetical protein [Pseudoalteromonas sp. S16_S37]|uniref:hypothetical protein n=1 Tax=Pseudoalteromonas sp. S16_S37 TaxID=2720228 RepID=UPI001681C2BA|nr:hypothetical protein [Pseudoalteromonas sp. S16_S37]MBD1584368.1 hypothetical protein [Pseudoalteromonas sp. S16_S37]
MKLKLQKRKLKHLHSNNQLPDKQTPNVAGGVDGYTGFTCECTITCGACFPNTFNDGTCLTQSPELTGCACPTTSPNICY